MKPLNSECKGDILLYVLLLMFSAGALYSCHLTSREEFSPKINELDYFEARGFNMFVFSNWYDGNFSDSKISGIEIIHHGIRTATNGDVRLNATPQQWDPIPTFVERKINHETNTIEAYLKYPEYNFRYRISVKATNEGMILSVILDKKLPRELTGIAGFNLEFLPSSYFKKTYQMDEKSGILPLYPAGNMKTSVSGINETQPFAKGNTLILAPEDPVRRIAIHSEKNELMLFDGRSKAQNGWYVVRSLIPPDRSDTVIKWSLKAGMVRDWVRPPVIAYSQVGYHPDQLKRVVIELDKNDKPQKKAHLLKIRSDGNVDKKHEYDVVRWGDYLRYQYYTFDFTPVKEDGIYVIEYNNKRTGPFRIACNVYEDAWYPTLDVFFPVQMDHMLVNEAYRVWHGAAHLDDALQAPVNHVHFDLYAQGPSTDSPYRPGEHIPGLNTGGWFDAGDYDIRTQTQYSVIINLVMAYEHFGIQRDQTTIDQKKRYADIHFPDGKPDILQQIEHGVLALMAQYKSVGHAIPGIISSDLSQYTHLGDALTMTDNLIYHPGLDSSESDGYYSGIFDDRWAFTGKSTPLDYGSVSALAAASRALRGYNDQLADECLKTSLKIWYDEHGHDPDIFYHGNTTGGRLEDEELKAAVELLITTGDKRFAEKINELLPYIEKQFVFNATTSVRAIPYMDTGYVARIKNLVSIYSDSLTGFDNRNPFGVPISTGGWAGSGRVIYFAITNYILHEAFPDLIDAEYVYRGLNYIFGCHPGSNISFVSGIGTNSKMVAYGMNRADFSFIAGGIVPGVLIIKPDYPENKEDWPFLWGENEYVVNLGASYIYLVNAADNLLNNNRNNEQQPMH
ncbi:MAG: glycoside hydrolase family 9 protein [Bacteroidales bacterium]|nr:glycoside hydrolase family 9 protein [Bacteroidales bacterium]